MQPHSKTYEAKAVAILCVTFGVINVETFGINYLVPFIRPDLHLTNFQVGALFSSFWIAYALSSYVTGLIADKGARRKHALVLLLCLIAICSGLGGLATSFAALLAARLLMGLLEGPILPLVQSLVALQSSPERKGLNMGIVQTFGASLLGWLLAPILLAQLATALGWRAGFFVVAIPTLVCAGLVALVLRRDTAQEPLPGAAARGGLWEVLRYRNIWLSCVLSAFSLAYLTIGAGFIPLYAVQARGMDPATMGLMMSVLGLSSLVLGVLIPALSDRFGRKPVAVVASLLGAICPLAMIFHDGGLATLAGLMFIGWASAGASTLFFATIPAESVPERYVSTAIGFNIGVSTLVGGVAGPVLAGWTADAGGLDRPLYIVAGCAALMALVSFGLRETRPPSLSG